MFLTMSKDEEMSVITIISNPKSIWLILCQILGSLCDSPVCAISQHMKPKMTKIYTALGIVQIIVGVLNIMTGTLAVDHGIHSYIAMSDAPFWLGGVSLVVGMVSIVAVRFPSFCLLLIAVVLNNVSTVLAVIGFAMYSCDLSAFLYHAHTKMIYGALDVTVMIFFALQFCATISFSVLICSKEDFETILCAKFVENPQFYKPLKEVTVSHVC